MVLGGGKSKVEGGKSKVLLLGFGFLTADCVDYADFFLFCGCPEEEARRLGYVALAGRLETSATGTGW
jgi:hypothetical protein